MIPMTLEGELITPTRRISHLNQPPCSGLDEREATVVCLAAAQKLYPGFEGFDENNWPRITIKNNNKLKCSVSRTFWSNTKGYASIRSWLEVDPRTVCDQYNMQLTQTTTLDNWEIEMTVSCWLTSEDKEALKEAGLLKTTWNAGYSSTSLTCAV